MASRSNRRPHPRVGARRSGEQAFFAVARLGVPPSPQVCKPRQVLILTEVLPLPQGGFGARCSCGWFETGPVAAPEDIDCLVADHAAIHRGEKDSLRVTHGAQ